MRSGISITLTAPDRVRLEALVADRNTPQKHVWRARVGLLSVKGHGTHAIMREAGVSKIIATPSATDRFGFLASPIPTGPLRLLTNEIGGSQVKE